MSVVCPQCKTNSQVVHLPEFWKSLSQDAELKKTLAQPSAYSAQWLLPGCLTGVGLMLVTTGNAVLGVGLLAIGVATGVWMYRRHEASEESRADWTRMLYCRRCPAKFLPEAAL
jgi:hypothetical protein